MNSTHKLSIIKVEKENQTAEHTQSTQRTQVDDYAYKPIENNSSRMVDGPQVIYVEHVFNDLVKENTLQILEQGR